MPAQETVFFGIERAAHLKLDRLDVAVTLEDLAALPGNGLEALTGDSKEKPPMASTAIRLREPVAEELEALNMSAAALVRQPKAPTNRTTGIIDAERAITGDTDLRLAHLFGTSARFRLNLQSLCELRLAGKKPAKSIKASPRLPVLNSSFKTHRLLWP